MTATPLGPYPSYTTVSNALASASAPDPLAIARSMLSFGIEYDFAFSIAFCNARLPAGSPPPSFAATMIARDSFENSFPRFASAAPFLCLIEDHLLCPDTRRLPHRSEEQLVHARILRQLGVERRHEDATVAHQHRLAPVLREHRDAPPHGTDPRRPDEDAPQRLGLPFEPKIRFEACDLAPRVRAMGEDVEVLAEHGGEPVLVR